MKTLLYITPRFPPSNAIGARRALNIARHIDRDDWRLIVLSAPVPSSHFDPQLESLVPPDVLVSQQFCRRQNDDARLPVRNRKPSAIARLIAERGPYYIPFDEHMWHLPHAFRVAKHLVHEYSPDLILVNADPWSGLLLGHKLSKWSGIPWIADLRDPWTLHSFKMRLRPAIVRTVIRYYESLFFHSASHIVLNTQQCCEAYRNHYAATINGNRMTWIRNAFDREIYRPSSADPADNRIFSMHYFGSFRIYTDPDPLFHLLTAFIQKHKLTPADIELVLYGEQRQRDLDLAAESGLIDYIRLHPAVSVRDALLYLERASVLVLVEGPNRKLQLPAKLYDYLAAGKPVLALSDNQELDSILHRTSTGIVAGHDDLQDGLDKLELLFTNSHDLRFIRNEIEKYAVERQIREFTALFNQVLSAVD